MFKYVYLCFCKTGMTYDEIREKYRRVALNVLGVEAPEDEVREFMYRQILYKSCATNGIIDSIANMPTTTPLQSAAMIAASATTVPMPLAPLMQDAPTTNTQSTSLTAAGRLSNGNAGAPALKRGLGLFQDLENLITRVSFMIASMFGSYTDMRALLGPVIVDTVERILSRLNTIIRFLEDRFSRVLKSAPGIWKKHSSTTGEQNPS
jgi:hypothetical protein